MTLDDMRRVMAAVAVFEYRFGTPNAAVLQAWHAAIGDLDAGDAVEAVRRYYAVQTDRIMPGHIRQGVNAIRAERRRNQPAPARELPSRFEDDINRKVRMDAGAATLRQVLEPLLGHIAATRPELPSAMNELRALTSAPADLDDVVKGEVCA
ncbi:hypothetical protein ACH4T9_12480 [Micromonospora sp. NPDC020750]|uniref:hypothetical protein n=1 Tax=unclassified Micromonospora TaxID=2617518 RepID=UPI0037A776EA